LETTIKPPNAFAADCPSRKILDLIGDKWASLVILLLECQPKRFSELQRSILGISQKMLTQTLRELERSGMVKRTAYPEIPPRVEYELTPLGQTLCTPIKALLEWSYQNIGEVTAAQEQYDLRLESKT
jgi:DNA-binding HxlR family transcriptional regulator